MGHKLIVLKLLERYKEMLSAQFILTIEIGYGGEHHITQEIVTQESSLDMVLVVFGNFLFPTLLICINVAF